MRSPFQMARDMVGSTLGAEMVAFQIEKSLQVASAAASDAGQPQSQFWDPASLFMGREWLVKRSGSTGRGSLTFFDMRRMAQNPIIGSIIQTRLAQSAGFMRPSRGPHDPGFRIVSDDEAAMKDIERITALTQFTLNCGLEGLGEGSLEELARKCLRDSLTLDQMCAEVIPRRNGEPGYMVAVDGSTIRRLKRSLEHTGPPGEDPFYAQIIQDKKVAEYSYDRLAYGIRNPLTDVRSNGYGVSELEFLFRTVTAMLNSEHFNSSLVSQGGINKGLLVVKKPPDRAQFEAFKREFREAYRNAASFWRPPVLGVPEGADIEWVKLDQSQRDMEYAQLFDFLVKQACGVYQIDPAEINWSIGAAGSRTTFESKQGEKHRASQKKGLEPLLNFFGDWMTRFVISKIDDRFRMEFVGVAEDRKSMAEVHAIEVKTTRTVNEIRADRGDPPIEGGDIILDPTFVNALNGTMSNEEAAALMADATTEENNDGDGEDDDIKDGVVEDDDTKEKGREGVPGR